MCMISKTAKVYPTGRAISYYKERGYDAKYKQELEVKVEDLSMCSTALVDTTCDYCGKQRQPIKYVDYNAQTKNGKQKCCCLDCVTLKREEVMLEKYGYKNAVEAPEIQAKIKATNLEKYGYVSPMCNSDVKERQKKSLMDHYGVENPSLSKEVQEKRKQTFIERYGVENPLLTKEIREKADQTIMERYGVKNVSQNPDIKIKKMQTFLECYGAATPLQNKDCLEKMKQTNIDRYGVEFTMQLEEVREKAKKTSLERYGFEYPMQSPEILEKWFAKNGATFVKSSKQQQYLCDLYDGILNYPFKCFALDVFLPEEQLNIEFDGSGHRMSVTLGSITEDEFEKKELYRNVAIKKAGYKQMRIISLKDLLPSDEVLLQMLDFTRNYFSQYPNHSWIEFNIDESIVRNAECKDGSMYSYGELRKITQ